MESYGQKPRVYRTAMFKVPEPEKQEKLLEALRVFARSQARDGKPYILDIHAGLTKDETRAKGYTVVAQTLFANRDDMEYYDNECPAHANLKKVAAGLGLPERPLIVYFEE
ncbi:hypothetical protein N656DRAFT_30 [Canariomyces notabilis]|uniref:Stress-response A/B barrel domain-containing protein n=1 Tax=Canariomyces notabilis TaxID=2074819 RepID=A0AAN6TM11_9PEZI|nr:hypothetical protein N656DRAFT_30 [Canariomyces arenarius]